MGYLDAEWYAYYNRATEEPCWQARTVTGDNLIASAYTEEHIRRIVREHNALRSALVFLTPPKVEA